MRRDRGAVHGMARAASSLPMFKRIEFRSFRQASTPGTAESSSTRTPKRFFASADLRLVHSVRLCAKKGLLPRLRLLRYIAPPRGVAFAADSTQVPSSPARWPACTLFASNRLWRQLLCYCSGMLMQLAPAYTGRSMEFARFSFDEVYLPLAGGILAFMQLVHPSLLNPGS